MSDERRYDVIVFGATGFTGGLAAEYLARHHGGSGLRWALAGRSADKLKARRAELEAIDPACVDVGLVEARVDDPASLASMAGRARVLISTVGPFAELGEPVVAACVEAGTDYVDITGEPEFVDAIRERHDARARERGLRIVPNCGFDCIPADLGALFTVRELPKGRPIELEGFVRAAGSFSGGTWHSAIGAMAKMRKSRAPGEPQGRRPRSKAEPSEARQARPLKPRVRFERTVGAWVVPFPVLDPVVVLRSARALDEYGPDFRYAHYARVRRLPTLLAGVAGVGAVFTLAQWGPTRSLLLRVKARGEGPSAEQRAKGRFEVCFVGRAGDSRVVTAVRGGDPGYTETSKMVSEAALCLAQDRERLPDTAGVITPALAMGDLLTERLRAAGISFEVLERI